MTTANNTNQWQPPESAPKDGSDIWLSLELGASRPSVVYRGRYIGLCWDLGKDGFWTSLRGWMPIVESEGKPGVQPGNCGGGH